MEKNLGQIILESQFAIRDGWLGHLKFRRKPPRVREVLSETPEHRFYQLLLSRALSSEELAETQVVLDVGSRNGSYLTALARSCPKARIIGIELDGGRRFWSGYRRSDWGEAHAQALREAGRDAHYHWGDIRNFSAESLNFPDKGSVLISFFYPFVSEIPCTRWGLPLRFAEYSSVLEHLRSFARQRPSGTTLLLSVHQGEWEGEIAQKISTSLGLEPKTEQVSHTDFAALWPSEHDATLLLTKLR